MQADLDCIPCIIRLVIDTVRQSTNDEWLQWKALDEALGLLSTLDKDTSPSELAHEILKPAMKTLGVTDPYAEQKRNSRTRQKLLCLNSKR